MFLQRVPSMTTDQVRKFLDTHDPKSFTLLDVRQPEEYKDHHLPGAKLIPVGELPDRLAELDPKQPTIVYCRSGGRGGNATAMLMHARFKKVWNMAGGTLAYHGLTASGPPETGFMWFDQGRTPADHMALAWVLEEGARQFYSTMAKQHDGDTAELFGQLARAEEHHREACKGLYKRLSGKDEDPVLPQGINVEPTTEGGMPLADVLDWASSRPAVDTLELAIAMEVNAYDQYLKVAKSVDDVKGRDALLTLAREEKVHLDRLVEAFVRLLED